MLTRTLISCLICCYWLSVYAQDEELTQPHSIINFARNPLVACRLASTSQILGYTFPTIAEEDVVSKSTTLTNAVYSGMPIFKQQCRGVCVSVIAQESECLPRFRSIHVQLPSTQDGEPPTHKWVSQVVGCECKPKRCKITTSNGDTIFRDHGTVVIDACERRCTCFYGNLINCCRQRKEFRLSLTPIERSRYISSVIIAASDPVYQSEYHGLVTLYHDLFAKRVHGASQYLPWHRWFLLQYENLLQKVDCRVTIPYWDWSKEAGSPWSSLLWSDAYFGPAGSPDTNWCVPSGPFGPGWSGPPNNSCLQRRHLASVGTPADIANVFSTYSLPKQFALFRHALENSPGLDAAVHCAVDGTMCSVWAATAPEFFLHHAFIDKLWADWQSQSADHVTAWSGGGYHTPMPTIKGWASSTAAQMADLNNLQIPGAPTTRVCYSSPSSYHFWFDQLEKKSGFSSLPLMKLEPVFSDLKNGPRRIETWFKPMSKPNTAMFVKLAEERRNNQDVILLANEEAKKKWNPISKQLGVEITNELLDHTFGDTLSFKGCFDSL